jgi:hypothetical protein
VCEVEWHDAAAEDLLVKVGSDVAGELVRIAPLLLTSSPVERGKDGGRLGQFFWRRGLSEQRRNELDSEEKRGEDHDDEGKHSWDFVYVYKASNLPGYDFKVLVVLSNEELGAALDDISSLDYVPRD